MDNENLKEQLFPKYNHNAQPGATPQQPQSGMPPSTPVPVAPPQNQTSPYATPPSKKGKIGLIVTILILLLLGAGGAAAYTMGYFPVGSQSADVVLTKALASYKDVTTVAYDGTIESKVKPPKDPNVPIASLELKLKTSGKVDFKDPESPIADLSFSGDVRIDSGDLKMSALTDLDIIATNKKGYFKFNKLDLSIEPLTADPAMIEGVNQLNMYFKTALPKATGKWVEADSDIKEKVEKDLEDDNGLGKRLWNYDYLDSFEKLGSEDVSGVATNHYRAVVNNERLKAIFKEYDEKVSFLSSNPYIAAVIRAESDTSASETTTVDFWLGKKDWHFYKIAIGEFTVHDAEGDVDVAFKGDITFKDYNAPVTVTTPSDTITVDELTMQVIGPLMGQPQSTQPVNSSASARQDAEIKSNLASLRAVAEIHYDNNGNSYKKICKNGELDSNALGNNSSLVVNLLKAKGDTTQTAAGIVCVSSATSYAVSLPLESGSTWCIDSTGFIGQAKASASTMRCAK
jgi:hypothetical protein